MCWRLEVCWCWGKKNYCQNWTVYTGCTRCFWDWSLSKSDSSMIALTKAQFSMSYSYPSAACIDSSFLTLHVFLIKTFLIFLLIWQSPRLFKLDYTYGSISFPCSVFLLLNDFFLFFFVFTKLARKAILATDNVTHFALLSFFEDIIYKLVFRFILPQYIFFLTTGLHIRHVYVQL